MAGTVDHQWMGITDLGGLKLLPDVEPIFRQTRHPRAAASSPFLVVAIPIHQSVAHSAHLRAHVLLVVTVASSFVEPTGLPEDAVQAVCIGSISLPRPSHRRHSRQYAGF